ncbi:MULTISPECIES: hypothetical protein [Cohnella]|jgi:hypothetical protein|uniref:hypothetical protein n=1 Tax=Cohnella TaxID=329857 RepID=UPI000E38388D|nr:hypothetical protein [Cohnella sp.]REK66259.1 MAG: hypothetical protein C6P35_09595 [Cohnella sp.]
MSLLLPLTTVALVAAGAFCLFMAMEHDRKTRESLLGKKSDPALEIGGIGSHSVYAASSRPADWRRN